MAHASADSERNGNRVNLMRLIFCAEKFLPSKVMKSSRDRKTMWILKETLQTIPIPSPLLKFFHPLFHKAELSQAQAIRPSNLKACFLAAVSTSLQISAEQNLTA